MSVNGQLKMKISRRATSKARRPIVVCAIAVFVGAFVLVGGFSSPSSAWAKDDSKEEKSKKDDEAPEWPKKLSKYKRTGETELCLNLTSIQNSRVIDNYHILFETNGNKDYVNILPHRCHTLSSSRGYSYETSLHQLCNTDIITVFDNLGSQLMPMGSCGLGKFERVEKIKE